MVDSLRTDALGIFGNPICRTPSLDALAKDGVAFSNCYVQNPVCTPSRASFMTGLYPHVSGRRSFTNFIPPGEENLLRYFRRAGYAVTAIGKNDCIRQDCVNESVDSWIRITRQLLDGTKGPMSCDPCKRKAFLSGQLTDEQGLDGNLEIKEQAVHFINNRKEKEKPWFLYAGFYMPHPKYGVHEPWYSMYDQGTMPEPISCEYDDKSAYMKYFHQLSGTSGLDSGTIRKMRAIYYGMVSLTDQYVGEILNALRQSGAYDNTMVVFLSDHGDYTGDYGLSEKSEVAAHDCILRTPLIIKPSTEPGILCGLNSPVLCEAVDILPTLLDACGIEDRHIIQGKSLLPILRGQETVHKDAVFSEGGYNSNETFALNGIVLKDNPFFTNPDSVYGPREFQVAQDPELYDRFTCLRTNRWKYVQRGTGPDELYDLESDPHEIVNRISDTCCEKILSELRQRMLEFYLRTADPLPHRIDKRLC